MNLNSLWPGPSLPAWAGSGAVPLALVVALASAGLLRLLGRRDLAVFGAVLGVAAGWSFVLGAPLASPRQLAERLPLLAFAGTASGLLLALLAGGRAWAAALGAGIILGAGAWWLAGAPSTGADLRRALVPLLAAGASAALASLELRSSWRGVGAFALLFAATTVARPPAGPWEVLAAVGLAAALGGTVAGAPWNAAAAAPAALTVVGLAAGPVVARGAAVDWTAGGAPLAALLLGPAIASRIGGRAGTALGWALAGGVPLLLTWLLARGA